MSGLTHPWVGVDPKHLIPKSRDIPITDGLTSRFWKRVNKGAADDCWVWTGAQGALGYGYIGVGGRGNTRIVSRVSWVLHFGQIPPGLLICHKCDNPSCVNPQHLFLGTLDDNAKDMMAKGRGNLSGQHMAGEKNGNAKLTQRAAEEIRAARARGEKYEDIAARYGVNQSTIGYVVRGVSYKTGRMPA